VQTLKKFSPILLVTAIMLCLYAMPEQAFAASEIEAKVKEGLKQVQAFLTGIVVMVGICVGVWIIIKKLPGVDDPHTKNEMFRGVGMVFAGVGLAAALVWIVPWVYALFA
jgi:preprotein translocase subunit SecE